MEPSATIAEWRNGQLTLFDATQWVWGVRLVVSAALGIRPEDIHVTSSYLGGGFGCKGYVWPHQIITAPTARELDRPLKVVLPRAQDYIHLRLGDTSLPETGGTFGSSTTIGVGSAVYDGATKLKRSVLDLNGGIMPVSQREISEFLSKRGLDRVSADGSWSPGPNANGLGEVPDWSMDTFGAVFTEVRIDQELPIPRVTRCLGIYSAGRIVNSKTARSQMIGGMVWGIGQALLEHSAMDHSLGRYLSKNLSGYLVPVNADVPALEAYFVDEVDQQASAFGGKGIGELGAVGVAPAIVNAIYHATGKRIRQVPVLPEMLL